MSQSGPPPTSGTPEAAPMTPLKGLLVLLAIIVVIGAFVALCLALDIHQMWAAFLFLLYWAGIEHVAFDKLLPCLMGAVGGLLLAWSEQLLPGLLGEMGGLAFFGLILVAVYCQVMGWVSVLVNLTFMLFLTVGTMPAVQKGLDFPEAFMAIGLGCIYFAGLAWIGTRVMAGRAAVQPQS